MSGSSEKHQGELDYWLWRMPQREGPKFWQDTYFQLYRHYLGLEPNSLAGKTAVDIGCGPHGCIGLFTGGIRIGVDPLCKSYARHFDLASHNVIYLASHAEDMPLIDGSIDVVTSRNSIDHVDDPARVIADIARILKPGGEIIFAVNYGHEATLLEPHVFDDGRLHGLLNPFFNFNFEKYFEANYDSGIAGSATFKHPYPIVRVRGTKRAL